MDQLQIFVIVLNSASILLRFLLTRFKISACRLEERNKDNASLQRQHKDENFQDYQIQLFIATTYLVATIQLILIIIWFINNS